jgi:molecular chaperone GrpE
MAETEQAVPERAAAATTAGESDQQPPGASTAPGAQPAAAAADSGVGAPVEPGAPDATATAQGQEPEDEQILQSDVDTPFGAHGELLATAAKRDEYLALAQRTQADFENYRKRVARESAVAQERGVAKLARELLPALDNLDRALEAAAEEDPLLEGVRLVRSELSAALGRVGIESFSPAGEPFDPEQHEAIVQRPVEDAEPGSVAEVYQPGYRLNGTIIRPARVVVAG